jgi:hypothetical protein
VDPTLAYLVRQIESGEDLYRSSDITVGPMASLGLTLTVGGGIVSGDAVRGLEYVEWVAQQFGDAIRRRVEEILSSQRSSSAPSTAGPQRQLTPEDLLAQALSEDALSVLPEPPVTQSDSPQPASEQAPPGYIHLKDAQFLFGARVVRLPYWRGRLDFVSGWCFGRTELSLVPPLLR